MSDKPIIKNNSHRLSKENNDDSLKTVTNDKQSSSADNVDRHLQLLEQNSNNAIQRQLTPEQQLFTEEELARLINPDRLKLLMDNGEDLVSYLTSEIDKFGDF